MRKLFILSICFLVVGCSSQNSENTSEQLSNLTTNMLSSELLIPMTTIADAENYHYLDQEVEFSIKPTNIEKDGDCYKTSGTYNEKYQAGVDATSIICGKKLELNKEQTINGIIKGVQEVNNDKENDDLHLVIDIVK